MRQGTHYHESEIANARDNVKRTTRRKTKEQMSSSYKQLRYRFRHKNRESSETIPGAPLKKAKL